jgi:hypothetical protein
MGFFGLWPTQEALGPPPKGWASVWVCHTDLTSYQTVDELSEATVPCLVVTVWFDYADGKPAAPNATP